jgi:hypothetical protein
MPRNYAMLIVLVPEDELGPEFSDGTMHVQICTHIHGTPLECAAMLQNMAADVMTSIKNEIAKGGK